MTKSILGWPVHTSLTTVDAGGGAWRTAYPVTNLNKLPVRQVARSNSTAAADTKFRVTLPEALPVRLITFVYHNAGNDASYRIRGYGGGGGTELLFDTGAGLSGAGAPFWTRMDRTKDIAWRDKRWWSGKPGTREKALFRSIRPVLLPRTYWVNSIQVEITDPNNPAGYFQVGYFDVADAYELFYSPDYGAEFGIRDRNRIVEADGGAKAIEELPSPNTFNGTISYLPEIEARTKWGRMLKEMTTSRPLVWLPYPDDPKTWLETAALTRHVALNPRVAAVMGRESVKLSLEEVI